MTNFNEPENNKFIDSNVEGKIYQISDSKGIKIFYNLPPKRFLNKVLKIKKLAHYNLDGVAFPTKLYANINTRQLSYEMSISIDKDKKVAKNLNKVIKNNNLTINEKLELLIRIEELLKKIHSLNMVVGDLNDLNVLLANNKPIIINTDNFKVGFNGFDITNLYQDYYLDSINNYIDTNMDKFSFGLLMIFCLTNERYNLNKLNNESLKRFVGSLDIGNDLKEIIYSLVSNQKEKEYVGKKLVKQMQNPIFKELKIVNKKV